MDNYGESVKFYKSIGLEEVDGDDGGLVGNNDDMVNVRMKNDIKMKEE